MTCDICYSYTGFQNVHSATTCPLTSSLFCRRCHTYGHSVSSCKEGLSHWERPTSYEELIPYNVRRRWDIHTSTPLVFDTPRNEDTASELAHEIVISLNDKKMRVFMADRGIKTTHQTTQNLVRIREWAVQRGFKIRMTQD
jgi:hypothetical protein